MNNFKTNRKTKLLTIGNPKTLKSVAFGYFTAVMHLSPCDVAGYGNVCPSASNGCKASCLHTSGNPMYFENKFDARNWRTWLYFHHRSVFIARLCKEIKAFEIRCKKINLKPAIRLNGTSDILINRYIFEAFPNVQFYDYTKVKKNLTRSLNIPNYHVIFSATELTKTSTIKRYVNHGINVAIVFDKIPSQYLGLEVYSGMAHDLRFLDPQLHVIGLEAIGKAKADKTGFVVRGCYGPFLDNPC